jgi:hypothetical protein
MKLFEKVDSVAHYNYQDSNGGPIKFCKNIGGFVGAQHVSSSFENFESQTLTGSLSCVCEH